MNENSPLPSADETVSTPTDWPAIQQWRKAMRETLIARRLAVSLEKRQHLQKQISADIATMLATLPIGIIGFYWPIKGEFDLRPLLESAMQAGWQAALPVVESSASPLQFRHWQTDSKMLRGVWNIPIPEQERILTPDVLLVPLVGVDKNNYRLGYGGGYYDRTIAAYDKKPLCIGLGMDICVLDSIYPQSHDIAMDKIVLATTDTQQN